MYLLDAFIQSVDEFEDKGSFVLMGMVKNIKRGKGWSRVEILDKTGSVGIFDEEQTKIETGKTYLILASDNRIVSAIPVEASCTRNSLVGAQLSNSLAKVSRINGV